jgi:hypothetical protein
MPKFKVRLIEEVIYKIEIEAVDAEEAEQLAHQKWANLENPGSEFEEIGLGVETDTVEEI